MLFACSFFPSLQGRLRKTWTRKESTPGRTKKANSNTHTEQQRRWSFFGFCRFLSSTVATLQVMQPFLWNILSIYACTRPWKEVSYWKYHLEGARRGWEGKEKQKAWKQKNCAKAFHSKKQVDLTISPFKEPSGPLEKGFIVCLSGSLRSGRGSFLLFSRLFLLLLLFSLLGRSSVKEKDGAPCTC